MWFAFNSTAALVGPQPGLTYTDVPLSTIVVFVRAGAILPLQRAVVQHTDALGGGLDVHVYAGRDGAFVMTEDDGATTAYATAPDAATRTTAWAWADATRTLSWTVSGGFGGGPNLYTTAFPVLFVANATAPLAHAPVPLGASGSITF